MSNATARRRPESRFGDYRGQGTFDDYRFQFAGQRGSGPPYPVSPSVRQSFDAFIPPLSKRSRTVASVAASTFFDAESFWYLLWLGPGLVVECPVINKPRQPAGRFSVAMLDSSPGRPWRATFSFSFRSICMSNLDQGRAAAALSIRKAQHLPRDLVRDSFASNVRSRLDVSTRMIKAVHSRGPTPPDDDADVAAMPLTKIERKAIRRAKKPKKTQVSMRGLAEIRDAHKRAGAVDW